MARRFALVAAAGELASEAGITGWEAGAATAGVRRCFDDWLSARGHLDNGEDAQALAQVRAFIEKNGDAPGTLCLRGAFSLTAARPNRQVFGRLFAFSAAQNSA